MSFIFHSFFGGKDSKFMLCLISFSPFLEKPFFCFCFLKAPFLIELLVMILESLV